MRIAVAACALAAVLVASACGGESEQEEKRAVLDTAQEVYDAELAKGRDFSDGPCIADPLPEPREDWVVVVVREPRDEDRSAAERCSAFGDGRAEHFVELDEFGHVIRAQ
jgi:hypothetical protein